MSMYSDQQFSEKPSKVQAIAIMTLIDGIINCIWGLILAFSLFAGGLSATIATWGVGFCCMFTPFLGLLPLTLGIFEIIYGIKLLGNPPRRFNVQTLAILQIINVITLAGWSAVIGILNLVFYNEPEVKVFIDSLPS